VSSDRLDWDSLQGLRHIYKKTSMSEESRLRSLRDLVILDTAPEPLFDAIARLASEVCGTPIALMSLVDEQRQWFKANVGLPEVNETPRDVAFCTHAIGGAALFEVPNATNDARFSANPLVLGSPDIRFYAGAPLMLPDGERVGTLCVIDRQPRELSPAQSSMLEALAGIASQALAMRQDLITKALSVRTDYERRIEESEAHHRALVEAQSELVSLAEPDGSLVYVSPAYARHFSLAAKDMMGTSLFGYVAEADRPSVRTLIDNVFSTESPSANENRMVLPDGSLRTVAWRNSLHIDSSGRRLLHSVGRDVTDRRVIEAKLRASQSLLSRTGKLSGVGGWELDLATGRLDWSEQTRHIHQVDDDFVPTLESAIAFYAPEARAAIASAVDEAIKRGTAWDIELPLRTAAGRDIWVRAMGEAECEAGVPVRLLGSFVDITESKNLAMRLDQSERFVRQITDNLPIGIAYADRELRYRFVNAEQCRRFGKPREEIIGRTREELTGRPYNPKAAALLARALAGEAQMFEAEDSSGAEPRLIESRLVPDVAEDGTVRGVYGASFDITQRAATEKRLRELTAILVNTPDFVVQTDWRGSVSYMNPAARAFCGLAADESTAGRNFSEFNSAETNERFGREIMPTVKARGIWSGEARVMRFDGTETPVSHMVIGHCGPDGRVERYSAVMRDISAAVEARRELQAQSFALRAVVEAIPAMVAVAGPDGHARIVNRAYERWTGVERELAVGRRLDPTIVPLDAEGARPWMDSALGGETASYARSSESAAGPRHVAGLYAPLGAEGGGAGGFVLVVQDVTERKLGEAQLMRLAQRDSLTGLLNRAGFEAQADKLLAEGCGDRLALLTIDLDHFKPVNDAHGHPAGDAVLRAFAQRIYKLVRPTDAVGRIGGDEFAILLSGINSAAGAGVVADKVLAAAREPFQVGTIQVDIGASVGIAFKADLAKGWTDLVARSDAALYLAKGAGRGQRAGG
jgi:diguanylate cyclase (GGDEF)-like protein/PAS domain S-box-containing protein